MKGLEAGPTPYPSPFLFLGMGRGQGSARRSRRLTGVGVIIRALDSGQEPPPTICPGFSPNRSMDFTIGLKPPGRVEFFRSPRAWQGHPCGESSWQVI